MLEFTQYDQSVLRIPGIPQKIISLVPNHTELLIELGGFVFARTSFCIEPHRVVQGIPVIGGTKTPRIQKIIEMAPDFVLANKEENIQEHVECLQKANIPVWVTYPRKIKDVLPLVIETSQLVEKPSLENSDSFQKELQSLLVGKKIKKLKACMMIWKDPWMAVSSDTYSGDLLACAGYENVCPEKGGRYPSINIHDLVDLLPDIIFLPSEPYDFTQKDADELKTFFRGAKTQPMIKLVSGEDMTWPGLRTTRALKALIHDSNKII